MKYYTIRWYYPSNNPYEPIECAVMEWEDLEKAVEYCKRCVKRIIFESIEIEDESGKQLYEFFKDGTATMNLPEILKNKG